MLLPSLSHFQPCQACWGQTLVTQASRPLALSHLKSPTAKNSRTLAHSGAQPQLAQESTTPALPPQTENLSPSPSSIRGPHEAPVSPPWDPGVQLPPPICSVNHTPLPTTTPSLVLGHIHLLQNYSISSPSLLPSQFEGRVSCIYLLWFQHESPPKHTAPPRAWWPQKGGKWEPH